MADADDLRVTDTVTIPGRDLSWTAVRSSGPGGQNVNKVASKVELRFAFAASSALSVAAKGRLVLIAGRRITTDGELIVRCDRGRDQSKNLEFARQALAGLIREALVRPKPRVATKPSKAAKRRRLDDKRRVASTKAGRRSVRDGD